jgi:UDP-glucose 4-epimerase
LARYLVTGGCGFIGSHLVQALLAAGHGVRVLDDLSSGRREQLPGGAELLVGGILDGALLRRALAGTAGCFHLAAIASVPRSTSDWVGTHAVNQTGAIALFDAARGAGLPVVYASSAAVYGTQQRLPIAEDNPTRPESAYGADKLGVELHARVAGRLFGLPTLGLRLFNVYGPRQDPASPYAGVVSIFARRLLAGEALAIRGDGQQLRDFVYVADAVRALRAAMEHASPAAPVVNVCSGQPTSILDLAETLGRLLDRRPELVFGPPQPGDIRRSLGDPAQGRALLGVSADTALEAGLAATLDWLRRTPAP